MTENNIKEDMTYQQRYREKKNQSKVRKRKKGYKNWLVSNTGDYLKKK